MDWNESSVSLRLVQAVATYTDTDPVELPPLYETIDPDAIETCITGMDGVDLSFEYAGVAVTVESTGEIQVGADAPAAAIWTPADGSVHTTE